MTETRQTETPALDQFYSAESPALWHRILGDGHHYHGGYFEAEEDLATGGRQAVRLQFRWIPAGSRVLDAGCGWGGPAGVLVAEHGCAVHGITIAAGQAAFCRSLGLDVAQRDLEDPASFEGRYDVAMMFESLSHIRDKASLLRRLRQVADRLVLVVNCCAEDLRDTRVVFDGTMHMCTPGELARDVEAAGWRIVHRHDRRRPALRTVRLWQENLRATFPDRHPPGQMRWLARMVDTAMGDLDRWGRAFPLVDLVAE